MQHTTFIRCFIGKEVFKMKKTMSALLCITILLFTVIGCNRSEVSSYVAYEELISNLNNKGYTVKEEEVEKSILDGERKLLTLNGNEHISIYVYDNVESMKKDASYISEDGFKYHTENSITSIGWSSHPHFYKSENMIVLYVGENSEIMSVLEELVGSQFAGRIE